MLQTTKFKQAFHHPYRDSESLKKQAKETNKKKPSYNQKKGGKFVGMKKMKHFKILFIKIYCNFNW